MRAGARKSFVVPIVEPASIMSAPVDGKPSPIQMKTEEFTFSSVKALTPSNGIANIFNRRRVREGNPLYDIGVTEFGVLFGTIETSSGPDFYLNFIANEHLDSEISYLFLRDSLRFFNIGSTRLDDDTLYTVKDFVKDYVMECLYGKPNPEGWSEYYYGDVMVEHPVHKSSNSLKYTIISLNDEMKWTRERIAQWIAELGDSAPKIERFPASWILSTTKA